MEREAVSAADDSDPSGRLAPRDASRLSDDALDVARFCWPDPSWRCHHEDGVPCRDYMHWPCAFDPSSVEHIAAAERVLVERGLGQRYVDALIGIYACEVADTWPYKYDVWALVAPLDARLRALARVVREQKPKEQA